MTYFLIFRFQLQIEASDNGRPSTTAVATVNISVRRNTVAPIFDAQQYEARTNEYIPVGSRVATVTATDNDPSDVRVYRLADSVHKILIVNLHILVNVLLMVDRNRFE